MSLFWHVFLIQLREKLGLSVLKVGWRNERKRTVRLGAIYLVALLSIGVGVGMYAWLLSALIGPFRALGMESVLLGLVLTLSMVLVFVLGFFYLLGVLYFSKDTEFLSALPIPQGVVFAAKFGQVLLGEIASGALLLLPAFIVFGVSGGTDLLFWLRALAVLVAAPCIPLAISGALSLLLMRFSAFWRRRDLLAIIGSVFLLLAIFAGETLLTSVLPQEMTTEAVTALLSDSSALLRQLSSIFPPGAWAAEGLLGAAGPFLLFLSVSIAALAAVLLLAGRMYYGGSMAQMETLAKGRKVRFAGKAVRPRGALGSLYLREWRLVIRSPIFALNGLTMIVIGPALLLMVSVTGNASGSQEMDALFTLLRSTLDVRWLLLAFAGLLALLATTNPAAATSVSREGKLFYIARLIPVSPGRQIMAKFLFGYSVASLTMVSMAAAAAVALGISATAILGGLGLGLLAAVAPTALSLLPDLLKPKLSWNSEVEAIKQNVTALLGMLIGWAYVALLAGGCYLAAKWGAAPSMVLALAAGLSAALGAVALTALVKTARKSWRRIEG